ncbi:hypothetical protein ACFC1R_15475 [Kitasatospora sp. NPDC056138]|uniref:hypothetical protein n=1 Tax=Kitasatospora sp. NPDC056138 TaxID=3345724 RepID=UPI0035E24B78
MHWRTAAHLRDLLMESNILPHADRRLLLYERWLAERLTAVEDPARHQLLHRFATWHQLRRLRAKAEAGPLGRSPTHEARQQIPQGDAFLTWLAARNRTLDQCRQADLEAWHADNYATRRPAQPFLRWCMGNGAMPRLALPPHVIKQDQAGRGRAAAGAVRGDTAVIAVPPPWRSGRGRRTRESWRR